MAQEPCEDEPTEGVPLGGCVNWGSGAHGWTGRANFRAKHLREPWLERQEGAREQCWGAMIGLEATSPASSNHCAR